MNLDIGATTCSKKIPSRIFPFGAKRLGFACAMPFEVNGASLT
jgi:hypothetical protein